MITAFAAAVTGPRGRWVTIAVWIAIGVAGYIGRSHIGEVTAAGQSSFLPKGAESVHAIEVLDGATALGGVTSPNDAGVPARPTAPRAANRAKAPPTRPAAASRRAPRIPTPKRSRR